MDCGHMATLGVMHGGVEEEGGKVCTLLHKKNVTSNYGDDEVMSFATMF